MKLLLFCITLSLLAAAPRHATAQTPVPAPVWVLETQPVEVVQAFEPVMFLEQLIYRRHQKIQAWAAAEAEAANWIWQDTLWGEDVDKKQPVFSLLRLDLAPVLDENGATYYQAAEVMPRIPGLNPNFWLRARVRPFAQQQPDSLLWVVFVRAIVETDGRLTHIRPYRFADMQDEFANDDTRFRAEAARAVADLPRFTPARHHGQPVRCAMVFEIQFRNDSTSGR